MQESNALENDARSTSSCIDIIGPSLSYERKIRLHRYAENRARSCLGLVNENSHSLWKLYDTKQDIALFKPIIEWSGFLSAKAVVTANAYFPHVLRTVYDSGDTEKFKVFLGKVLGDMFLDAQVLEDLNGTGKYGGEESTSDLYKQAFIKWWAVRAGPLASKACDFYVLEFIGAEIKDNEIASCYFFQESLAQVGGMPQVSNHNLERSQFDALLCKFERLPVADYAEELVRISVAFQRSSPMVNFFRGNPAVEMTQQFAKGLQNLLEDPPEPLELSVVKISAWVKDRERQCCVICLRKFSSLFRRRHHCRTCGEVICWQCSSTIRVPAIHFTDQDIQIATRHPSSIRVCVKCTASRYDKGSIASDSNQNQIPNSIEDLIPPRKHRIDTNHAKIALLERLSQDLTGVLEEQDMQEVQTVQGIKLKPRNEVRVTPIEQLTTEKLDVRVGSAWAIAHSETVALTNAYHDLQSKLHHIHFVIVGFTTAFSADLIITLLHQLMPNVPYIGGTIARGICDERGWVSASSEGLVSLWGIYDPQGTYSIEHVEYTIETARDSAYTAARRAYARVANRIDPGEPPAFILAYASPLFAQEAVLGLQQAFACSIFGGCSSDAALRDSIAWVQISSQHAGYTETGMALALCFPSVETETHWFSAYQPVRPECSGIVTCSEKKCVMEIDYEPAGQVYRRWLVMAGENLKVGFPRLGNMHPLGEMGLGGEIASTAVVTQLYEDTGALVITNEIAKGSRIVMMEVHVEVLRESIFSMGRRLLDKKGYKVQELMGCLMFLSAGVHALLKDQSMTEMVSAYREWAENTPLLGMTTFGEIGHVQSAQDAPHYDALMFGALWLTNRKRKEYLYF